MQDNGGTYDMMPCISVDPSEIVHPACPTWAFLRCLPARGPRVPALSCHTYITLLCSPFLRPLLRIKVHVSLIILLLLNRNIIGSGIPTFGQKGGGPRAPGFRRPYTGGQTMMPTTVNQ
jgi:hypothetical protein